MARITVEDCLENENNRFNLVRLASKRAKQLLTGQSPVTDTRGNKAIISALREIAAGKVCFKKKQAKEEEFLFDSEFDSLDMDSFGEEESVDGEASADSEESQKAVSGDVPSQH